MNRSASALNSHFFFVAWPICSATLPWHDDYWQNMDLWLIYPFLL